MNNQGTQATTVSTCQLIRPNESFQGKQALTYMTGISTESVGAKGICMHLLTIPPGDAQRRITMRSTRRLSISSAANRVCGMANSWSNT